MWVVTYLDPLTAQENQDSTSRQFGTAGTALGSGVHSVDDS
jgi:hypothetical protein